MENAMLTDKYQLTMGLSYFKSGRHLDHSVFDLFFRRCPFKGEFVVFSGLNRVLDFIENFKFTDSDLEYLAMIFPEEDEYLAYLKDLDCSSLQVSAISEGSLVFPRVPLIRIEGPLLLAQLIETPLLNLVNYSTLISTYATKLRLQDPEKKFAEFGLRRAPGPDGAMTASLASYIGGFDSTSNVLAGKKYGIPIMGTNAHAYITSFTAFQESVPLPLKNLKTGKMEYLLEKVFTHRKKMGVFSTNVSELIAFCHYAVTFPSGFLVLIDTYNTIHSGLINYILVAQCLQEMGYQPVGVRLDSGDLAYLSRECRAQLNKHGLETSQIVASNDIDIGVLASLKEQKHMIDTFGIGTNLVFPKQTLGGVYKLVECKGIPTLKISETTQKIPILGKKNAYRLYNKKGEAFIDVLTLYDTPAPIIGKEILCHHPFDSAKKCLFVPSLVESLLIPVVENGKVVHREDLKTIRERVMTSLTKFRNDHIRYQNPTPYKVSLDTALYDKFYQTIEGLQVINKYD